MTCFDHLDNDCDGFVDHGGVDENNVRHDTDCTTAEICDGFDNDNDGTADDGLGLGVACTVGTGACLNNGTIVCDGSGLTKCNAVAFPPQSENVPGGVRCMDGLDNDCDSAIDLADSGCQEAEKCDGKDNDGDGNVDEDFADLGSACTAGQGPCQTSGVKVCSGNKLSTVCDAVALSGSQEGRRASPAPTESTTTATGKPMPRTLTAAGLTWRSPAPPALRPRASGQRLHGLASDPV